MNRQRMTNIPYVYGQYRIVSYVWYVLVRYELLDCFDNIYCSYSVSYVMLILCSLLLLLLMLLLLVLLLLRTSSLYRISYLHCISIWVYFYFYSAYCLILVLLLYSAAMIFSFLFVCRIIWYRILSYR